MCAPGLALSLLIRETPDDTAPKLTEYTSLIDKVSEFPCVFLLLSIRALSHTHLLSGIATYSVPVGAQWRYP